MGKTKRYYANAIIDRHGMSSTPYHQSHYTCVLTIEEARKIIKGYVEKGGVLLSYIQEFTDDDKEPNILELKSYVSSINMTSRRLEPVRSFASYSSSGNIQVYEVNDDVWAPRMTGDELYSGNYKECPAEILDRMVMKVIDSKEDNCRKFIVFKKDEILK